MLSYLHCATSSHYIILLFYKISPILTLRITSAFNLYHNSYKPPILFISLFFAFSCLIYTVSFLSSLVFCLSLTINRFSLFHVPNAFFATLTLTLIQKYRSLPCLHFLPLCHTPCNYTLNFSALYFLHCISTTLLSTIYSQLCTFMRCTSSVLPRIPITIHLITLTTTCVSMLFYIRI